MIVGIDKFLVVGGMVNSDGKFCLSQQPAQNSVL